MKGLFYTTIILFCTFSTVFAQGKRILSSNKTHSGTTIDEKQESFLNSLKDSLAKFERPTSMGMLEIPIKVHIVRGSKDTDPVSIEDVKLAFTELNKYFIHTYIQFFALGDYNYINDDKFFTLQKDTDNGLCAGHDEDNVINLYIVGGITDGAHQFCGYTYYPQGFEKNIDRIFIDKTCLDDKVSLARQMGHFFTLYPTTGLHASETNEWVDGSNCAKEGDQICDTPADPGLLLETVDDRCGYIGKKQDQSGKRRFYKPDTHNIMSDNPRIYCCNRFSPEQYNKMLFAAMNIRHYLTFPKSKYTKKQLANLYEEKGIEGEIEVYFKGMTMTTNRDKNLYISTLPPQSAGTPYRMKIINSKKGYVYVLEGDSTRKVRLEFPRKGDKFFFLGETKEEFVVPANDIMMKVDDNSGFDGKNHIVILFSKKQLQIEKLIEEMNKIEEPIDVIQRVYTIIGTDLIPVKNLTYDKALIKVSGIATDQTILPIIIEYQQ